VCDTEYIYLHVYVSVFWQTFLTFYILQFIHISKILIKIKILKNKLNKSVLVVWSLLWAGSSFGLFKALTRSNLLCSPILTDQHGDSTKINKKISLLSPPPPQWIVFHHKISILSSKMFRNNLFSKIKIITNLYFENHFYSCRQYSSYFHFFVNRFFCVFEV
jgi:hypothetical protein